MVYNNRCESYNLDLACFWNLLNVDIIDMVSIEARAHNDEKRHRDGDRTIIGLITWGDSVENFRCKIDREKKTVISASFFLLKLCWHFSLLHSYFFHFLFLYTFHFFGNGMFVRIADRSLIDRLTVASV